MKRAFSLALALALCVACTPANQVALPDRDQVEFFERPLILAAVRKSGTPAPVIVVLKSDPWAMVIGSDSPIFAMYEDGTVIRRTGDGYISSHLARGEQVALIERVNPTSLRRWYGGFEALPGVSDQPDQHLLLYTGKEPTFVSVYGSLDTAEVRSAVPQEVIEAYDQLTAFNQPGRPWLPEYVEVMIWPYEHAPEASIRWPEKWPGLNDPLTVRRDEDSFSLFMPSGKLDELRTFLKRQRDKGAIEIDGRKWSASIRFPFPHEELWMGPHPELESTKR